MTNYELNLNYKCKLLTSSYLFFLLLLIVSGSFENAVLSNVFYYLAFVMPIISVTQIILEERYKKDARSSPVPDDFKYLAADLKLSRFLVGHDALVCGQDRDPESAQNLRDLVFPGVDAKTGLADPL